MSRTTPRVLLLAGVALFLFVFAQAQKPAGGAGKALHSGRTNIGRYVFRDVLANDMYLLDTYTGQLWRVQGTADNPLGKRAIVYRDENGKKTPVPSNGGVATKRADRYVFGDIRQNNFYMLDSETGRLWHLKGTVSKPGDLVDEQQALRNFMVVCCEVEEIDWLQLGAEGHLRARFNWNGRAWKGVWITP
jgi:hypothetical protein